jgi:hypothetical protein
MRLARTSHLERYCSRESLEELSDRSVFPVEIPQATKKKASHFGLGLLVSHLFLDWCGGGDLNPYALRR